MKTTACFTVLTALFLATPAAFATHCHEFDHFKMGLFYSPKAGSTTKPLRVMAQLSVARTSVYENTVEAATGGADANIVELKPVGDHYFAEKEIVSKVGECTDNVNAQVRFVVFNADSTIETSQILNVKTLEGTGPVLETETSAVLSKEQYAD